MHGVNSAWLAAFNDQTRRREAEEALRFQTRLMPETLTLSPLTLALWRDARCKACGCLMARQPAPARVSRVPSRTATVEIKCKSCNAFNYLEAVVSR